MIQVSVQMEAFQHGGAAKRHFSGQLSSAWPLSGHNLQLTSDTRLPLWLSLGGPGPGDMWVAVAR